LFPPEAPAFDEPWQAQAFAIAVSLNERGLFSWSEWAEAFGAELASGPQESGNEAYYQAWLRTLEKLVVVKGVAANGQLRDLAEAWIAAAEATPHGRPIVLGADRPR
jgi:nitrile hydratase accessory protein